MFKLKKFITNSIIFLLVTFFSHEVKATLTPIFEPLLMLSPQSVRSVDLDNDGDMDLLIASSKSHNVSWFKNADGHGDFEGPILITDAVDYADHADTLDFDNDGDLDILVVGYTVYGEQYLDDLIIHVYENTDGTGNYQLFQILHETNYFGSMVSFVPDYSIQILDINKDLFPEIIINRQTDQFDCYQYFPSENVFNKMRIDIDRLIPPLHFINTNSSTVMFFNEFHFYNPWQGQNRLVWANVSDTLKNEISTHPIDNNSTAARFIYTADLDGDNDLDLIANLYNSDYSPEDPTHHSLVWYENEGHGTFKLKQLIFDGSLNIEKMICKDIENDGDIDIIFRTSDGMILGENTNGLGLIVLSQVDIPTYGASDFDISDIDNDNNQDLITVNREINDVDHYEYQQNQFQLVQTLTDEFGNYRSSYTSDIDGDGDTDMMIRWQYKMGWLENPGSTGSFHFNPISINPNCGNITASDIDKDGDTDFVLHYLDSIWCYRNTDGSGNFEPTQTVLENTVRIISIGDIDGDGDNDLVYLSGDNYFYWIEYNSGSDQFSNQHIIKYAGTDIKNIEIGDLDGDKDTDLLFLQRGDIRWLENRLDQSLDWQEHFIANTLLALDLDLLDADLDTTIDIIVAGSVYVNEDKQGNFIKRFDNDSWTFYTQFIDYSQNENTASIMYDELKGWDYPCHTQSILEFDINPETFVSMLGVAGNCWLTPHRYIMNTLKSNHNQSDIILNENGSILLLSHIEPITFNADQTVGYAPMNVQFKEANGHLIGSRNWNFGDNQTSGGSDLSHTYTQPGIYNVTLDINDGTYDNYLTKIDYITVLTPLPPLAGFQADIIEGYIPLVVHFQDTSKSVITAWSWDFGDGDTSHVQNPVHEYTYADSFTVTLIVSGPVGSDTLSIPDYIIVQEQKPVAHFGLKQIIGLPPLTVEFTDSSTGVITSWLWDFGDGDTSHVQNPTHTYINADTFTVTLTVSGPGGTDTLSLNNLIIVLNPSAIENESEIPTEFSLMPIYPNPFNPVANIRFAIPKQTIVEITIYNIYGNKVEQVSLGLKQPGIHLWEWDASRFSTGTYLVRIQAGKLHDVRKCVLMK